MPSAAAILEQATAIARGATVYAIAWHVAATVALLALAARRRPQRWLAMLLLVAPIGSVAALAYAYGNPVNGVVFGIGAAVLAVIALDAPSSRAVPAPPLARAIGLALIALGWAYPHFGDPALYPYAAPLGVLPCPTLSAVIGFSILGGGLGSRRWSTTLAALGLLYGVTGVLWLGVWIDAALIAGAVVLLIQARAQPASRS